MNKYLNNFSPQVKLQKKWMTDDKYRDGVRKAVRIDDEEGLQRDEVFSSSKINPLDLESRIIDKNEEVNFKFKLNFQDWRWFKK